jgi:hypothetical protein
MVFMARAAAPMLPGWLVSTSTMRTAPGVAISGD